MPFCPSTMREIFFLKGMEDANQELEPSSVFTAIFQSPPTDRGSKPRGGRGWGVGGLPNWHMALTEDERLSVSSTFLECLLSRPSLGGASHQRHLRCYEAANEGATQRYGRMLAPSRVKWSAASYIWEDTSQVTICSVQPFPTMHPQDYPFTASQRGHTRYLSIQLLLTLI